MEHCNNTDETLSSTLSVQTSFDLRGAWSDMANKNDLFQAPHYVELGHSVEEISLSLSK